MTGVVLNGGPQMAQMGQGSTQNVDDTSNRVR